MALYVSLEDCLKDDTSSGWQSAGPANVNVSSRVWNTTLWLPFPFLTNPFIPVVAVLLLRKLSQYLACIALRLKNFFARFAMNGFIH
eukprot:4009774-Ditylum_brightwellii.AAC.1